jgi:dolichol-phosphate mannosyltransferase
MVIGSRYVRGGGTRNWSLARRLISWGGCAYARVILGLPVADPTGGFNGMRREVLDALDLRRIQSEGYAFQIELKYRAYRQGFDLREIPITFWERRVGKSKMSWRIFLEAMRRVWVLRWSGG